MDYGTTMWRIGAVRIVRSGEEWQIEAYYPDGARFLEADYFTDEQPDAERAARSMVHQESTH